VSERQTYKPGDDFVPFSNGTEFEIWLAHNCQRGRGGCRRYKPNAESSRNGCPIEVALAKGTITGTIPARIGLRGGFLEPGPNGTLVRPAEPCGECPEYKGYDEPDDRPRRGPKPPEGQEDLLDPRNQPSLPAAVLAPSIGEAGR
jgi:hypothetical protein